MMKITKSYQLHLVKINVNFYFSVPQIAARGIAKYCLRGMLGDNQRETLFLFLDSIASLCAEEQDPENLPFFGENLNIAMARLERDFPASLQV